MCGSDCFLAVIAVLFPPLAVWVKRGLCSADSLINIALCCLGFLPGLLHAWYIISVTPDPTYDELQDPERGTVTHYYVQGQPQYAPRGQRQPGSTPQQNYGTVNSLPESQFPGQHNGFVQPPQQPSRSAGPSQEQAPPPTYQDAVSGDNKLQTP